MEVGDIWFTFHLFSESIAFMAKISLELTGRLIERFYDLHFTSSNVSTYICLQQRKYPIEAPLTPN